jgi:hypothetical protein
METLEGITFSETEPRITKTASYTLGCDRSHPGKLKSVNNYVKNMIKSLPGLWSFGYFFTNNAPYVDEETEMDLEDFFATATGEKRYNEDGSSFYTGLMFYDSTCRFEIPKTFLESVQLQDG